MSIIRLIYKYLRFWGGSYVCVVCNKRIRKFFPFSIDIQNRAKSNGFTYDFKRMETLNYHQCNCPFCMSTDRERLYLIFLEKYLNDKNKTYSILDFAPTAAFASRIRRSGQSYTSTDLFRKDVDIQLDICDMKEIGDNHFDFIICSHVLEHVPDPDKAMREIFRILRAEGKAIIMVPLFWDVQSTLEDTAHNTDELRLRYYGQEDHVRIFSKTDFINRLQVAGFNITQIKSTAFDVQTIKENGISSNSILYICSKIAQTAPVILDQISLA